MSNNEKLLGLLRKIKVREESVKIDEEIFNGLTTKEEIVGKFEQYAREFNNKLTENIKIVQRKKLAREGHSALDSVLDFERRFELEPGHLSSPRAVSMGFGGGSRFEAPGSANDSVLLKSKRLLSAVHERGDGGSENSSMVLLANGHSPNHSIASITTNVTLHRRDSSATIKREPQLKFDSVKFGESKVEIGQNLKSSDLRAKATRSMHQWPSTTPIGNFEGRADAEKAQENKIDNSFASSSEVNSSERGLKLIKERFPGRSKQQANNNVSVDKIDESSISPSSPRGRVDHFSRFIEETANSTPEQQNISSFNTSNLQRICEDFGIDSFKLNQLRDVQERENFIIESMCRTMQENLSQWIRQRAIREERGDQYVGANASNAKEQQQQQQQQVLAEQEQHKESRRQQNDVYHWLEIETRFEALRNKLKVSVFEALNDEQNKERIEQFMRFRRRGSNTSIEIYEEQKLELSLSQHENVKETNQIVQNMKRLKKRSHAYQENSQLQNQNEEESTAAAATTGTPKSKILLDEDKQDLLRANHEWDNVREEAYQEYMRHVKFEVGHIARTDDFRNIGFIPMMQSVDSKEKDVRYREELMERWLCLETLTPEELKFLADTNELLNKHLDRKHVQNVVQLLDREVLDELELRIADEVIEKYEHMRDALKAARQNFVLQKAKRDRDRVNFLEKTHAREAPEQIASEEHRRIKIKMVKMLERIARLHPERGVVVAHNESQSRSVISPEFLERNCQSTKAHRPIIGGLDASALQGRFHPPSELIVGVAGAYKEPNEESFEPDVEKLKKQLYKCKVNNQEEERLRNTSEEKIVSLKQDFISFYAAGPLESQRSRSQELLERSTEGGGGGGEEFKAAFEEIKVKIKKREKSENENDNSVHKNDRRAWITPKICHEAAVRLQRAMRTFIAHKEYKKKIEEIKDNPEKYAPELERMRRSQERINLINNELFAQVLKGKTVLHCDTATLAQLEKKLTRSNTADTLLSSKQRSFESTKSQNITKKASDFEKWKDLFKLRNAKEQKLRAAHELDEIKQAETVQISPKKTVRGAGELLKERKLLFAAKNGNIFMVKNSGFVYSREDINTCDSSGNCALYYVTKNLDYDFIDFLLQQNADVNVHCAEGNTPLHLIFKSNNEEYIVKFMESGGDLNSLNDAHQTPLAFASMSVLERLGLIKGIALGLSRSASGQSFDNNLLYMQHTRTNAIGNGLAVDPSMEGVASDKAPLEFTYDYIRTQDEGVRGQEEVLYITKPVVKEFKTPEERIKVEELEEADRLQEYLKKEEDLLKAQKLQPGSRAASME